MTLFSVTTLLTSLRFKPQKVIFFGDSITAQGVRHGGYITRMRDALTQKGMANDYELIGAGIGGNKVYDLFLRMDDDVLAQNPDVVFIYIGVNDVWHKATSGTGTDIDKFDKFYTAIVNKLLDKHIRLILCTPPVIRSKNDFTTIHHDDMTA